WSGHETFFWRSFNAFIQTFYEPQIQDMRETALFMSMTLLEIAIANELTHVDFHHSIGDVLTHLVSNHFEEDGSVEKDLQKQIDLFIARQGTSRKQIEDVPEMPPGRGSTVQPERGRSGQPGVPPRTGSVREDRPWYDGDPGLDRLTRFAQEKGKKQHLQLQKTFKELEDTVYGSAYYEDAHTLRICLASVMKKPVSLKRYMQAIIARFRGSAYQKLDWRDEYFRMDVQRKLRLGQSWDKYPYPNTGNGLPGVTAWISLQGTAEMIIRLLE
ncbi:MAG TPA: hypothetical protein VFV38_12235, partial [Ktedonobacteraceae bacterium]|nr:hypothetical protein [Ktedonobacteraceae bacterium]